MDLASIIGIIAGIGCLVLGYSIEGGSLLGLVLRSAFIIVIGGATGSVILSYGMREIKKIPKLILSVFMPPKSTVAQTVDYIIMLSETARREGLLSIEKIIDDPSKGTPDPLLKKGMLMVIDGVDLEQIREMMEAELYIYEEKAKSEISMFEAFGGFAPTYGMIGTIMGLVNVLSNTDSPEEMVSSIAVAFVATLYGVASANVIALPMANKLKLRLKNYLLDKEMIIEGVCGIRNGVNSKMLREKLSIYLPANARGPQSRAGSKEAVRGGKGEKVNA